MSEWQAGRELDAEVARRVFGRRALAHTSRPLTHGTSHDGYWSESWMDGDIRIVLAILEVDFALPVYSDAV
jgi:hypothetical protein